MYMIFRQRTNLIVFAAALFANSSSMSQEGVDLELKLQTRVAIEVNSKHFHSVEKSESWKPSESAIIVCDMWDLHHCHNAVIRLEQMASPMNAVLSKAREQGVTIIHAPSSCMEHYADHPARKRTRQIPLSSELPKGIEKWCAKIASEDSGEYPIDQSDGGGDDDPQDHERWAKSLEKLGRNPKAPWKRQTAALTIDGEKDFISDNGKEIWSVLESEGIQNIILLGVHTNMCVLGRPFGLRQLVKNGKNVVLMRDMTDAMYNPASKPYVSHFSGTDLIIEHIEKWVCPTITSDQLIGGSPYRFPDDKRKHIAMVIAEDEYQTEESLTAFATKYLRKNFRLTVIHGSKTVRNDIIGVEKIADADLLILSVRRRTLPFSQLQQVRDFEASGKPMIGIRTSSHAFCLRKKQAPAGLAEWKELDEDVWGGNYSGHTPNGTRYTLSPTLAAERLAFLKEIDASKIVGHMSLYKNNDLGKSTTNLFWGHSQSDPQETQPVAWLNKRANGGQSFYTSLGHVDDFAQDEFQRLLYNAVLHLTRY